MHDAVPDIGDGVRSVGPKTIFGPLNEMANSHMTYTRRCPDGGGGQAWRSKKNTNPR